MIRRLLSMEIRNRALWAGIISMFLSCQPPQSRQDTKFRRVNPQQSGITFENTLTDSKVFNILNYLYYYNGGGVAIGDINGDHLPDIFLTANQLPNKLYLNLGNWQFEDITEKAGVAGSYDWSTGVSMADVNGDGWLDIYVCNLGKYLDKQGQNELYINQQDGTFKESASEWGLDLVGFSTQGYFMDYDLDGDLDLFQLNHSINPAGQVGPASQRSGLDSLAGDRILKQENGRFTDVSATAGIWRSKLGYGLSAAISDLNKDGFPDIYVCNDFHEDDYLYLNQGNGTFQDVAGDWIGHSSRFSMGSDWADLNNDARPDLMTLDMKPWREKILKTAESPERFDIYQYKLRFGYRDQYPRNALQVARASGSFQEWGQLLGLSETDWSWSVLMADFDNDRQKDIYITNGIYRRPNDMDYLKFISDPKIVRKLTGAPSEEELAFIKKMPSIALPNAFFQQKEGFSFENRLGSWTDTMPSFSNGAAYGDLDRDGDLDLVVNNINAPASLLENTLGGSYLRLQLRGNQANSHAIGSKVWLYQGGEQQYLELQPARGFQSTVEPLLHFGLGNMGVDSLRIEWPDGGRQLIKTPAIDTTLVILQESGLSPDSAPPGAAAPTEWVSLPAQRIPFNHTEDDFSDFSREPLIPHLLSREGPKAAVGDVNGDGWDDVYMPGAAGQAGQLYLQSRSGSFRPTQADLWAQFAEAEEIEALFFDADNDQDEDLYIVCGQTRSGTGQPIHQDRLYLNQNGQFVLAEGSLPEMTQGGSCIDFADIDQDNDLDLVVGARNVPGAYGLSPKTTLLINDGKGHFSNETKSLAPQLARIGMVSDVLWVDLDGDVQVELVVVGEWMPITIFKRGADGEWTPQAFAGLDQSEGWWNSILAVDLDGDGDQDLIGGNLGLNSSIQANPDEPCTLYAADFDQNGTIDPIMCYYREGNSYPVAHRDELLGQLISLRRKYPDYQAFAGKSVEELLDAAQLARAVQRRAVSFASQVFWNEGNAFRAEALPREAQLAPVYGMLYLEGGISPRPGLYIAGNFYGVGPDRGRYDASEGLCLRYIDGAWTVVPALQSGFVIPGECRALRAVQARGGIRILATRNGAPPLLLRTSP